MFSIILLFACMLCLLWYIFARRITIPPAPNDTTTTTGSSGGGGGGANIRVLLQPRERVTSRSRRCVDCAVVTRYCTANEECASMCCLYKAVSFLCDHRTHTCQPSSSSSSSMTLASAGASNTTAVAADAVISHDNTSAPSSSSSSQDSGVCNAKLGEYAMLTGYTNLGVALWQCVPLYRHFFTDRLHFCEGGHFDTDATVRDPSYRDCFCPPGTIRIMNKLPNMYDIQLPHCVPQTSVRFYTEDMTVV